MHPMNERFLLAGSGRSFGQRFDRRCERGSEQTSLPILRKDLE